MQLQFFHSNNFEIKISLFKNSLVWPFGKFGIDFNGD